MMKVAFSAVGIGAKKYCMACWIAFLVCKQLQAFLDMYPMPFKVIPLNVIGQGFHHFWTIGRRLDLILNN
jgi:hypothetical protein